MDISNKRRPEALLPLRPVVFSILLVLKNDELHGYGIMKRVNESAGGGSILGPGTLYRTLKELRDEALVEHSVRGGRKGKPKEDERRSYYRLTRFGHRVVEAEAARIASLLREAKLLEA